MSDKDEKRFTIATSEGHHKRLGEMAKLYKITQGELLEVLMDNIGKSEAVIIKAFIAKRKAKVESRTSIHAQIMRLREARKEGKE